MDIEPSSRSLLCMRDYGNVVLLLAVVERRQKAYFIHCAKALKSCTGRTREGDTRHGSVCTRALPIGVNAHCTLCTIPKKLNLFGGRYAMDIPDPTVGALMVLL